MAPMSIDRVDRVAVRVAGALRREQARRPHETQDPVAPDAMPERRDAHPHLAMAFAVERTVGQHLPHRVDQERVGRQRLGASLCAPGR
jgi:hypothetical protein